MKGSWLSSIQTPFKVRVAVPEFSTRMAILWPDEKSILDILSSSWLMLAADVPVKRFTPMLIKTIIVMNATDAARGFRAYGFFLIFFIFSSFRK